MWSFRSNNRQNIGHYFHCPPSTKDYNDAQHHLDDTPSIRQSQQPNNATKRHNIRYDISKRYHQHTDGLGSTSCRYFWRIRHQYIHHPTMTILSYCRYVDDCTQDLEATFNLSTAHIISSTMWAQYWHAVWEHQLIHDNNMCNMRSRFIPFIRYHSPQSYISKKMS